MLGLGIAAEIVRMVRYAAFEPVVQRGIEGRVGNFLRRGIVWSRRIGEMHDGQRLRHARQQEEHVILIDTYADGYSSRIVKGVAGTCFLGKLSFVARALAYADVAPGRLPSYPLETLGRKVSHPS